MGITLSLLQEAAQAKPAAARIGFQDLPVSAAPEADFRPQREQSDFSGALFAARATSIVLCDL